MAKANRRTRKNGIAGPKASAMSIGGRRAREVVGILLVTLTVLVILSLFSFNADDPALSTVATDGTAARNWAGRWGAFLADTLIQMLGATAWLVPLFTFYAALVSFVPGRGRTLRRLIRLTGMFLVLTALASMPAALEATADIFYGHHAPPGGFLGQATGSFLAGILGKAGSMVVLTAILPIGLIMTTGLSLQQILSGLDRGRNLVMSFIWMNLRRLLPRREPEKARPAPPPRAARNKPVIVESGPSIAPPVTVAAPHQMDLGFSPDGRFELPPLSLLNPPSGPSRTISRENLLMNSRILEKKLKDFGIDGRVTQVHPGPVITMYEYAPAPGVKVNRIVSLTDDLAMAMSAVSVRVVAPIPGKAVVGIEIPNAERETVSMMEILSSEEMKKNPSKLSFALGKDIFGHPVGSDLARMPHLLIAGTTGSGKSVMLNSLICSILFRATPSEVGFLLIDPKMVELMPYQGIPHLIGPVVTNPKKASAALAWAVETMETRYKILADTDARNIEGYNQMIRSAGKKAPDGAETMSYLVVVIDELADLMLLAPRDVENSVTRLAQMARAVGIHLVLATQRPSVNVITGIIKANLPARLSFKVSSKVDSRVILDTTGAELLLGEGDMLFLPPGTSKLKRIHGAYINRGEIGRVVDFVRKQGTAQYDSDFVATLEEAEVGDQDVGPGNGHDDRRDDMYDQAVDLARSSGWVSISMIQRRLRVGYNRAARMVEMMEKEGIIGPADGVKPRRVL